MNYEIKKAIIVEDEYGNERIRTMVKIGAMEFAFASNDISGSSDEKCFNFACSDSLLKGACKVIGIEERVIEEEVKEAALPLFQLTVDAFKEVKKQEALDYWKSLGYWEFIKEFKADIPTNCSVEHMSYERGIELINEGGMNTIDNFPETDIQTPYSNWSINIREKTAYTGSTYRPRPAYTYYEITHGYDEKLGKPRKVENILKVVLKAIETLKVRDEHQKAAVKKDKVEKGAVLHQLGKWFTAEEERKYSSQAHRGKRHSWVETKYKSDYISARKVRENEFKVVVVNTLNSDQVNLLNEFLRTL